MLKSPSSAAIPGVTDTLDFVKNLWGSMNLPGASLPGMGGPALSTDELDKRIADMKAVESWLNLNLTMLRGTIQAMEVQRGTLATLKSMGASMAEVMRQSGVSPDKMATMPFAPFFGAAAQGGAAPASAATAAGSKPAGAGWPGQAAAGALPGADAAAGMAPAMAWWNMLQEQFTQAVTTAMAPGAAATTAAPAAKEADKPAAAQAKPPAPPAQPATTASARPAPEHAPPDNGKPRGKPKGEKA